MPYVFSPKEEGRSDLYDNAGFELSAVIGLAVVATVAGAAMASGGGGGAAASSAMDAGAGMDDADECCTSCCDGFFSEMFG
jgi:hypothetical protein